MKKRLFIFLMICFCVNVGFAQKMSDIFTQIPDSLVQTLNKDMRKSLLSSFTEEGKEAKVQNMLGGTSELKVLSDNYFLLQTSSSNSIEVKMLPINEYYKILCLINTYCGPACDSKISFYTTDWKPLKNTYFSEISPEMFYNKNNLTGKCKEVKEHLDIHPIKYSLNKDNTNLNVIYSVSSYLNKADYEALKPCIQESFSINWVDGKYQIQ